jgi:hypothetical protein
MNSWTAVLLAEIASVSLLALAPWSGPAEMPEQKNMTLIGHDALAGHGDGGEGMALEQMSDGRRILFIAHVGQEQCLSIVDVTQPALPVLINQLESPGQGKTRCNSLGLAGGLLAVANQTDKVGLKPAGVWLLDVSDLGRIKRARSMEDLKVSFVDMSGPNSRGAHWLWFTDGEFAHVSTGTKDSNPTHPNDDQFYVILDVRNPREPHEVGRWWLPGTQKGDACLPACLPERQKPIDHGYRMHGVEIYPQHPNRAYVGYIDGGQLILDISGLEDVRAGRAARFQPKLISRVKFQPPFPGFTHTVHPIFSRGLTIDMEETNKDLCTDAPKFVWMVDIRAETNPVVVGTAPFPEDAAELCKRGGRSGTHNLAPDFPAATSAHLENTFVGAYFNAGIRIYRFIDAPIPDAPPRIEEIGYYIPPAPPGNPSHTIQMNHVYVDENDVIYAIDRVSGGLYIFKFTGPQKLD